MQPEMTTSAIGGVYVDQLLAIERLSRHLPPDMKIVVKENPKQTAYQRPHSFFERLAAVPNALLVPSDCDTYRLIRDSDLVATVTGTAGWEAINLGKPTLVFGKAWYESLPGVIKYSSALDIAGMVGFPIDKLAVEKTYRDLMGRAYPGIISSPYFKLSPGLNIARNNALVADALGKVIANAP